MLRGQRSSSGAANLGGVILVLVLLATAGAAYIHFRNGLIELDVAVDTQWKQVENQLLRQFDLIPNLAQVTRGFAEHERGVLKDIADARSRYFNAPEPERAAVAGEIEGAISKLLAVAEAYPNLKADRHFRDLNTEIAGSQNRISVERKRYNELVGQFNSRLRMMPWRLAAGGFDTRTYFSPPADRMALPTTGF